MENTSEVVTEVANAATNTVSVAGASSQMPFIVLSVLSVLTAILLVALILAQKKDSAGFTSSMGGMASGGVDSSYWGKNKKNSIEGKLELLTKVTAFFFFVFIIAANFV